MIVRKALNSLFALVFLCVFVVVSALWHYRDIPANYLESKYGSPESLYKSIDGVKFHYRDEGPRDGPAVVMIHAHWASLIMWDAWADALKNKYRVIRFDLTGHGLTGPDPSGDYTLERGVALIEALLKDLDVERFRLVGTSVGGTHAIHFTDKNPHQVERLVLLNPGALNAGVRGRSTARSLPWWIDALTVVTPRSLFQFMLQSSFGNPDQVTDDLVTRWHEMQMREGQREAELARTRQYVSGDIEAKIKAIAPPTLIMWGEANPVVTIDQAYEFVELLENAEDKRLIVYPGLGHMAALEDPIKTAGDIRAYFDDTYPFETMASN